MIDRYGRLDILVNNAGITVDKSVRRMTPQEWDHVIEVNLNGAFYMSRAALQHMIDRGYGRIVNISSVIGETGNIGQANYAAAKSGLFGLTMTMALEGARSGITVNCVAPGFIATEMVAAVPEETLARIVEQIPARPAWRAGGGRACGRLPGRSRLFVHHRTGLLGQRRAVHVTRTAQQSDASMNGSDATTAAGDAVGPEAEILAAVDPLALGEASAQLVVGLALNPLGTLQAFGSYASGLAAATSAGVVRALGGDAPGPVEPERKDKRFDDPTWQENPAYFWLQQSYLLFGRLAQDLVEVGAGSGPGRRSCGLQPRSSWTQWPRRMCFPATLRRSSVRSRPAALPWSAARGTS